MSIGLKVFTVGMGFLFLTSCSGNQLGAQDLNAALEKKIQEVQSSVFVIEGLACGIKSLGTGVLLEEGVLTNAHVVAGVESVNLTDSGGTEISSHVIAIDFETDLALIDSSDVSGDPLVINNPRSKELSFAMVGSAGIIEITPVRINRLVDISITDIYGEGKYVRSGVELSANVFPGDSGGPILNAAGEVTSLIFSRSLDNEGISYGISSKEFSKVTSQENKSIVQTGRCR